MKFLLAAVCACFALGAPAVADQTSQPLSITIHGDGARATQLPQYDPGVPIAVSVARGDAGQTFDSLTITALGPAGESIRTPLLRTRDGSFAGSLALADQGVWSLRLTSQSGRLATDTSPVALTVAAPPPSNAPLVGLGVGAAIFIVIGGSGFWILRRTVGAARSNALEQAA